MTHERLSRSEKYNNIVLQYNFPQTVSTGEELPDPSREDIRDSEKTDHFSGEDSR